MQAAHHPTGNFQRHFIALPIAADPQPHVVPAQPVIGGFVVNIQQLACRRVLRIQRIEMLAQRLNAVVGNDKLQFDFLSHG